MKIIKYIIILMFFSMVIALADDVNMNKVGYVEPSWDPSYLFMTGASTGSNYHQTGKISIGGDQGTLKFCYEKFAVNSPTNISSKVSCHAEMEDNSKLLVEYWFKLTPGEGFWDNLAGGVKMGPNNGIVYWYSNIKLSTAAEKYLWVNDALFIGKGVHLTPPKDGVLGTAGYDIYRVVN